MPKGSFFIPQVKDDEVKKVEKPKEEKPIPPKKVIQPQRFYSPIYGDKV